MNCLPKSDACFDLSMATPPPPLPSLPPLPPLPPPPSSSSSSSSSSFSPNHVVSRIKDTIFHHSERLRHEVDRLHTELQLTQTYLNGISQHITQFENSILQQMDCLQATTNSTTIPILNQHNVQSHINNNNSNNNNTHRCPQSGCCTLNLPFMFNDKPTGDLCLCPSMAHSNCSDNTCRNHIYHSGSPQPQAQTPTPIQTQIQLPSRSQSRSQSQQTQQPQIESNKSPAKRKLSNDNLVENGDDVSVSVKLEDSEEICHIHKKIRTNDPYSNGSVPHSTSLNINSSNSIQITLPSTAIPTTTTIITNPISIKPSMSTSMTIEKSNGVTSSMFQEGERIICRSNLILSLAIVKKIISRNLSFSFESKKVNKTYDEYVVRIEGISKNATTQANETSLYKCTPENFKMMEWIRDSGRHSYLQKGIKIPAEYNRQCCEINENPYRLTVNKKTRKSSKINKKKHSYKNKLTITQDNNPYLHRDVSIPVCIIPDDIEKPCVRTNIVIPKGEDWNWIQCKNYILRGSPYNEDERKYEQEKENKNNSVKNENDNRNKNNNEDIKINEFGVNPNSTLEFTIEEDLNLLSLTTDNPQKQLWIYEWSKTALNEENNYIMLKFARILHNNKNGHFNAFFDEPRAIPISNLSNIPEMWNCIQKSVEKLLLEKCGSHWCEYIKQQNKKKNIWYKKGDEEEEEEEEEEKELEEKFSLRYFEYQTSYYLTTKNSYQVFQKWNSPWDWPILTPDIMEKDQWPQNYTLCILFNDSMMEMYCRYRFGTEKANLILQRL